MQIEFDELKVLAKQLRESRKNIVFTNGVFDILHRGHVEYLNKAKKLGDILVVGLNSDSSVRRLKGINRPVNSENDRIYVLDSLQSVDYTIVFDQDTPLGLIEILLPEVLVKGGDYDPDISDSSHKKYIVGSDVVRENGGKVVVIDLVPDRSTTILIDKIKET